MSHDILAGWTRTLAGGGFGYHGPRPDATTALLVRARAGTDRIAWQTAPVPAAAGPAVTFRLLGAIQVAPADPRAWTVALDGREALIVASPTRRTTSDLVWTGRDGAQLALRRIQTDRHGDLMGEMELTVPRAWTTPGRPLRVDVAGEKAGSATWFMVYEVAAVDRAAVRAEPAVVRHPDGPRQIVRLEIVRHAPPTGALATVGPHRFALDLDRGHNVRTVAVPEVTVATTLPVAVATVGGETILGQDLVLRPVRRRTLHLLHHSHVDIGYTHRQEEVERLQWRHLETALGLVARTRDLPDAARFRWCTEVAWPVATWLRAADDDRREALADAIADGAIEVGALFANELTALCSAEELLEITSAFRFIHDSCDAGGRTAMVTDIPGWTWALVPALAQASVRFLSLGLNRGHRIGRMLETWADRPFRWTSPSGEESLLCWIHGEGYSLFHGHMYAEAIADGLTGETLYPVLRRLEAAGWPHATCALRYSVGADNGPPHAALPEIVRAWNRHHVTPQLAISTVQRAFAALEAEAGDSLPTVRGDLTAYWEDGAASTARELALVRTAASRLEQSAILAALVAPDEIPTGDLDAAWRQVLLFDEHTWGAWNSISDPDSDLARDQWAAKQAMALSTHVRTEKIVDEILTRRAGPGDGPPAALEVINTEPWPRTDLVTVPGAGWPGVRLVDDRGREVPVQVLRTGALAFVARGVPPLSSRTYHILWRENTSSETSPRPAHVIEINALALDLDPNDGSLRHLVWRAAGQDLVAAAASPGLAGYLYVAGRHPAAAAGATGARVEVADDGPVVRSVRVTADAPGCRGLVREYRLTAGLDRLEISTTLDHEAVRTPEAVHLAFPLAVPTPTVRYDLAVGLCRAEADQAPGGNRNHLTVATYADVSGPDFGVTVACPDAPLIEVGALRADPIAVGWTDRLEPSATLYAYVMNNYWETNYRAEQPGPVTLRHVLWPHGPFDAVTARRHGQEARRPLHVVPVDTGRPPLRAPVRPTGEGLEILRVRPAGGGRWLLVLHNVAETPLTVGWIDRPAAIQDCDLDGCPGRPVTGEVVLPPHGLRPLLVGP